MRNYSLAVIHFGTKTRFTLWLVLIFPLKLTRSVDSHLMKHWLKFELLIPEAALVN